MTKTDALKMKPGIKYPRPTDKDRKNYSKNIRKSPHFKDPGKWLKVGDRVRANFRIFDLPGQTRVLKNGKKVVLKTNWGWEVCKAGAIGVVVHVEPGYWPTVRFPTGRASCVTDIEVTPI